MPSFGISIDPYHGRAFIAVDPAEDPLDDTWDWSAFDGLMWATTDEIGPTGEVA